MSGMIECPVCFCSLPASKINNHVEICLNREEKCSTRNEAEVTRSLQSTVNDSNGLSNESKLDDFEGGRSDIGLGLKQNDDRKSDQLVGRVSTQLTNFQSDGEKGKLEDYPSTCAARSIKNVLGKRKWSGLSPPIETKLKLKGPPRDIPITKTILNLPPPLKMRKDNLSKNEKMQDLDTIKNNQVNDSSAINSCTTQSSYNKEKTTRKHNGITNTSIPLAERMRPKDFDTYFGQDEMIGQDSTLRAILNSGKVPSMIFWGPPGCGKTSLVNIIASMCKKNPMKRFVKLSATTSGLSDVKEAVKVSKNEAIMFKKETIMFIDEIHRFNKLQQDFFLPHVENGTIILIGATTENPSFQVNNALLSRCKVIVLKKHSVDSLLKILQSAVNQIGGSVISNKQEKNIKSGPCFLRSALEALANLSDGDARAALNGLEMAANCRRHDSNEAIIDEKLIASVFQRNHMLYDRNGEEHYNIISAFHKSIRGSDDTATLYWLARMLEGGEDPLYVARRMIRAASEDIGIADSSALPKAVAAFQACHFVGMPECEINLAHVAVYLARAPKSIEIYRAYRAAKSTISKWKGPHPGVPLHLRNAPTKLMKDLGYAKDYKYNPDYDEPVEQDYLPTELKDINFFPT